MTNNSPLEIQEYITFYFDNQLFGVNLLATKEIILIPQITKVFHAEERIFGLINLRGDEFVVFDLKPMFNFQPIELTTNSRILIMKETIGTCFGFLVDKIGGIVPEKLISLAENDEIINKKLIKGIIKTETEVINIIDIQKIYSLNK